jgi:peptidoglycan/xylan/chitin deacetylase (PgdA/CDA1 family)
LLEEHSVGNHSFSHKSGWRIKDNEYYNDIEKCSHFVQSNLFRPPYGRITFSQIEKLKKNYNIIMWNVLSGDFDACCTPQQCLKNVTENITVGSVVVFHDSEKAFRNVKYTLPRFLEYCIKNNYTFETIHANKL